MKTYRTQVRFPDRILAEKVKSLAFLQNRSMNAQILHLIQRGMEREQQSHRQK